MSFLDQDQYDNPMAAMEFIGHDMATDGASEEDMIAAAEHMSREAHGDRDTSNLRFFVKDFIQNPGLMRRQLSHAERDIDNRVRDRMDIQTALSIGTTAIIESQQQEGEQ